MRKIFGLVAVGLAIASSVTLHFASQAKVNHPIPVPDAAVKPASVTSRKQEKQKKSSSVTTPIDEIERFQQVMQEAIDQNLHDLPMGEIMQAIAPRFLGTPYQAGLLEQSKAERLVVTLKGFDCVLFIETVLAIARGVAVQDYSYDTFSDRLRDQRYENGQIDGYCSRLHYFSAWIQDNQKRGTVKNIASELEGVPLQKTLNFMSNHRQSYPQIANDDANYQCIVEMEAELEDLTVDYIPTNQIRRVYSQLQPGDIIGVATNIAGLDVTHTGLVYRQPDGTMGLIHASPAGEVTIARDLQGYVGNVRNAIGILVARPVDPRQRIPAN